MLLATKTKNLINNVNKWSTQLPLKFTLKNIKINGVNKGCSGFITNTKNGTCVYINTESSCYEPLKDKILYRYARDTKDYHGYENHFAREEEIAEKVLNFLAI